MRPSHAALPILAVLAAVGLPGSSPSLHAQSTPAQPAPGQAYIPAPPEQMQALAWLEGEWSGEGWMERAGNRMPFRGGETVDWRMGDHVLVVEGAFTIDVAGESVPVHRALGILSWNPNTAAHQFRTYTAQGAMGEAHTADVSADRIVWSFEAPDGSTMRYTIRHTEDDRWFEEGHVSTDGETWQKFFEMSLHRVGSN